MITPTKIVTRTIPEQLADALEAAINSGEWKVGEKIPSEKELMELYGVSRNPLREALHYLIITGVVDARPGDGTYVRSRTVFEATYNKRLAKEDISSIMEIRAVLEPQIVAFAADRGTDAEMNHLAHLQKELESSFHTQDPEYINKDLVFHTYIGYMCHNPLLENIYRGIMERYSQIQRQSFLALSQGDINLYLHKPLCELITSRKSDEAAGMVRDMLIKEIAELEARG